MCTPILTPPTGGRASILACILEAALAAASGLANTTISLPPMVLTTRPPVDSAMLATSWARAFLEASLRLVSLLGSANSTVAVRLTCMASLYQPGRTCGYEIIGEHCSCQRPACDGFQHCGGCVVTYCAIL